MRNQNQRGAFTSPKWLTHYNEIVMEMESKLGRKLTPEEGQALSPFLQKCFDEHCYHNAQQYIEWLQEQQLIQSNDWMYKRQH